MLLPRSYIAQRASFRYVAAAQSLLTRLGSAFALAAFLFAVIPAVSGQAAESLHPSLIGQVSGGAVFQIEGEADTDGPPADAASEASPPADSHVPDGSSAPSDQAVGEAPALVASSTALAPAPIRPKVGVGQYTVVRGDTMFSIARRAELSLQALSAANGIVDPSAVKAGRVLYVPSVPGSVHVVAKDESLESIIRKYDVKADSVREANGLDKQPELTVGQLLVIPGVMRATASEIRPMPSSMNASVLPAAGEAAPTSKSTQPPPTANSRPTISAETGTMIWPIIGQISTPYGPTHRGLDVVAKQGTPIKAALTGKVIAAQEWDGPYGWYVIVQHGADFTTVYSHLSKIRVKEGDTVAQGHVVGDVGTTGQSTGPHLHFELRKSNLPLDPRPYLP